MDERVLQARVGIMVVSAILLTAILTLLFPGSLLTRFGRGDAYQIRFPSAPGVTTGVPVRKSGIIIGHVEDVTFAPNSSDVLVNVRIDPGREVFDNETARVNASLLGDAVVEFVPNPTKTNPRKLVSGEKIEIKSEVIESPVDLLRSMRGEITDSLNKVGNAGEEVNKLAKNLNKVFETQDASKINQVLAKTELAMDSFHKAMSNLNEIVGDEKARNDLKQSLAGVPKIMEDTNKAITGMQQAVARADKNLANLEHLTGPLAERGGQIVENLDSSVTRLDQFMQQLVNVTERFSSGTNNQGTLSRLMNDPELYNQLLSAVRNVNELTTRMRPLLEDVRVTTDKIARDPSQLGVSGVFKRSNGTKYPNYGNVPPPPMDWRDPTAQPPIDIGEPGCER